MQEWTVSNGNRLKVRKNQREMLENEHSVREMKGATSVHWMWPKKESISLKIGQ